MRKTELLATLNDPEDSSSLLSVHILRHFVRQLRSAARQWVEHILVKSEIFDRAFLLRLHVFTTAVEFEPNLKASRYALSKAFVRVAQS